MLKYRNSGLCYIYVYHSIAFQIIDVNEKIFVFYYLCTKYKDISGLEK